MQNAHTLPFEILLALEEYGEHADHSHNANITCHAEIMRENLTRIALNIQDDYPQEALDIDNMLPVLTAITNTIK